MARDTVVLEVAFVRLPPDPQSVEHMWREVDEQALPNDTRRRLAENGFRVGRVGSQLPATIRALLDEEVAPHQQIMPDGSPSDVTALHRQMRNRAGERSEVIVAPRQQGKRIVLVNDSGTIRGEEFRDIEGLYVVRTYPRGDGSVELELVPELRHGDLRLRYASSQNNWRHDRSRASREFTSLATTAVLTPGQTLLVTTTPNPRGLGGLFFAKRKGKKKERLALLIRVAQTQLDDLFDDAKQSNPLATPLD